MNFTKEITLNTDKLYENTELTIEYSGKLYKENSEKIFISYGYGNLWDNKNEIELNKNENNFSGTININSGIDFQFCFHDSNNNWDNNDSQNYILPIYKKEISDNLIEFSPIVESEKNFEIDTNESSESKEQTLSFTPVTISSEIIDIYPEKQFDNSSQKIIPENTVFTKVNLDENNSATTLKEQVISDDSFSEITRKAKENSVKAFDENHITAGSVYVNSLIEDYRPKITEPPKFIEDITITALVPSEEKQITNKGVSKIYLIKKKIKLSISKFIKLIKSALNYNEDKI